MPSLAKWAGWGVVVVVVSVSGCAAPSWLRSPDSPGNVAVVTPSEEEAPTTPESQLAQAQSSGTGADETANPNMLGDFLRGFVTRAVLPRQPFTTRTSFPSGDGQSGAAGSVLGRPLSNAPPATYRVPLGGGGAFKVAENESPRPQDRVFIDYNYYDEIGPSFNRNTGLSGSDLHVETIGAEKTFFDGLASVEVRVPVFQLVGSSAIEQDHLGDVSLLVKYAWWHDPSTSNLISSGLALTLPTGASTVSAVTGDSIHDAVFQPFLGYGYDFSADWYVHGFSSLAVPTDGKDGTILFNDVGIGYWLYRNGEARWLNGVVPTSEVHWNVPLSHQGALREPVGLADSVVLTEGVHLLIGPGTLQLGIAVPITGPKPFDAEGLVQFNFRF